MCAVVPTVEGRCVYLFDCASLRWLPTRTMDLPTSDEYFRADYADSVQILLLASGQVVVFAHRDTTAVYLVDERGHVERLADAAFRLHRGGVIEFEGGVYIFGGSDGDESSRLSQRLDLASSTWTHTADLTNERSNLFPAAWRNCIYICGEWECKSIDIDEYTPRTDTMVAIPVHLPSAEQLCAAFVDRDELVVFSDCMVTRFRKAGAGLQQVSKRKLARRLRQYSLQTNPVVYDGKVFFIGSSGGWWADALTSQELGRFRPAYIDTNSQV